MLPRLACGQEAQKMAGSKEAIESKWTRQQQTHVPLLTEAALPHASIPEFPIYLLMARDQAQSGFVRSSFQMAASDLEQMASEWGSSADSATHLWLRERPAQPPWKSMADAVFLQLIKGLPAILQSRDQESEDFGECLLLMKLRDCILVGAILHI